MSSPSVPPSIFPFIFQPELQMFSPKTCCNVTFLSEVKCFSWTLLAAQLTVKPLLEANNNLLPFPSWQLESNNNKVRRSAQQPFSVCLCAEKVWKVKHTGPDSICSIQFQPLKGFFSSRKLGFLAPPDNNQCRLLPPTIPDNTSWTNIENQFQSGGWDSSGMMLMMGPPGKEEY